MIENAILLTDDKVIGKYRKKKQPWITNDILDLCDDRRKLKEATKSNPEMKENYKQINIIIRKLMNNAKENWIQSRCTSINEDMSKGRANTKAYQTLKILRKSTRRKTMIILDKNNKPLANAALLKTWTEYFKDLYNYKIRPDNNLLKQNKINSNEDSLPILEYEVCNAILTLTNGK